MKHLPDWFPGASFKRLAKEGHALAMEILHKPYQMGKECVVSIMSMQHFSMFNINLTVEGNSISFNAERHARSIYE